MAASTSVVTNSYQTKRPCELTTSVPPSWPASRASRRTCPGLDSGRSRSSHTATHSPTPPARLEPPPRLPAQRTTWLSAFGGEFNRSTQHLLILPDWRCANGVACTDMVHAEATGRALGALEWGARHSRTGSSAIRLHHVCKGSHGSFWPKADIARAGLDVRFGSKTRRDQTTRAASTHGLEAHLEQPAGAPPRVSPCVSRGAESLPPAPDHRPALRTHRRPRQGRQKGSA